MIIETIVLARLTCYLATGNTMANGQYPRPFDAAVSDRTIPFGTIVEIDGRDYKVGDRTAEWVHEKYGLTIDLFFEKKAECKKFGMKYKYIKIKQQRYEKLN